MTERPRESVQGQYVEPLPATARSTGEPPGPELTEGAPIDPATSVLESTADFAGCAGPGMVSSAGAIGTVSVDEQLGAAAASVTGALNEVMGAMRTLVATDEGHRYLGAQVDRAGALLEEVVGDLWSRVGGPERKR